MKCPKQDCGTEGTGKFCHKCGAKRITEDKILLSKPDVIICSGTDEGGMPCGSPLKAEQAFCENCGTSVVKLVKNSYCGTCGCVITSGSTCLKCAPKDTEVPLEISQACESTPFPSKSTPEKDYSVSYPPKDDTASQIGANTDSKQTVAHQIESEDKQVLPEDDNQKQQNNVENVPEIAWNKQSVVTETGQQSTNETHVSETENQKLDMFNINRCLNVELKPNEDKYSESDPVTTCVPKESPMTNAHQTNFASNIDASVDDTTQTTQNQDINPVSSMPTDKTPLKEAHAMTSPTYKTGESKPLQTNLITQKISIMKRHVS